MKINTQTLKEIVSKAIVGAGMDKIIPITTLIGIKCKDNILSFTTTDKVNILTLFIPEVESEEFDICVEADKFSKLIAKTQKEVIELKVIQHRADLEDDNGEIVTTFTEDWLEIKADGKYKLPIIVDDNGKVTMPEVEDMICGGKIKTKDVLSAYHHNTSALPKEENYLNGYYCVAGNVITTDRDIATFNDNVILPDALISPKLMKLLTLFTDKEIFYGENKDKVLFRTNNMTLSGRMLDTENYPIEALNNMLTMKYSSVCEISKELILSTLDRMSLFTETFDNNLIKLNFAKDSLTIYNKDKTSYESIKYNDSKIADDFECCISLDYLRNQLKSLSSETIEIHFDNSLSNIKIVDDNITQFISLMVD